MKRFFSIGEGMTRTAETDDLKIEVAFSSEEPYERWWGIEILDHGEDSVLLDRMNDGAPVLFNHNPSDLRGTHEPGSVRIDKDRVMRGTARLTAATEKGREAIGLVQTKVLTKASVGYELLHIIEISKNKAGETAQREIPGDLFERVLERSQSEALRDIRVFQRNLDAAAGKFERAGDDPPTYRVMKWRPFENSLVTIPADNSVGVGRAYESEVEVRSITATTAATQGDTTVSDEKTAAAGASAVQPISAIEAEKERRQAIINLCKSNKIDSRVEARWIEDGTGLPDVAREILNVMEERGKERPAVAAELGLSKGETQRYSLFRAIRALKFGGQNHKFLSDAAFEVECSQAVAKKLGRDLTTSILVPAEVLTRPMSLEAMQRAMATTPGSKGGYLVNVENMGFIDILRNRSVARAMGARVLSGLEGNVVFPRQTGKPSVTWQGGEGVSVTAADQTLGQLSMTPKTAIVITDVSEQLLRQSSPSAEQFVMADLAADIAIDGVDAATINGTGGAQPLGIKNTTGVTTGQDAAAVTYAKVLAFVTTAGASNAIRGNPGFVTNIAGAAVLAQKQRFTSTDTPLWEGNLLDGSCVGFRAMASEQLASGNLIFGSWDELVIGEWGVLELATDTGGTRFNQAQVGIRAMWMVDVMLRYPQAFVVSTTLAAT